MTIASAESPPEVPGPRLGEPPWPRRKGLSWLRVFEGRAEEISRAREFVGFLLPDSTRRDDAVLIVSELATNAIVHTASGQAGGTFVVEVTRTTQAVRVAVTDRGRGGTPRTAGRLPPAEVVRGRGLAITATLADRMGRRRNGDAGHVVWARLDEPVVAGPVP